MTSVADGADILREHFGHLVPGDPVLEQLPGERDINIRVIDAQGAVLKIYGAQDHDWLLAQDTALRWLAATDLPVPRVMHEHLVAAMHGDLGHRRDVGPEQLQVRGEVGGQGRRETAADDMDAGSGVGEHLDGAVEHLRLEPGE